MIFSGCKKDNVSILPPVVETLEVSDIQNSSAIAGGIVTDEGNSDVTERGVCWDIKSQPTAMLSSKTNDGSGAGLFESRLSGLIPGQTYYLRAYASNGAGTAYGEEIIFRTSSINSIVYREDGRTVKYGDPLPIVLDVTGDGKPDYTIFVELTANSMGDRLYTGINPIAASVIKSGPPVNSNYLSMGYLISEPDGSLIDETLAAGQYWTGDHSVLAIRNTFANGDITYEGNWSDGTRIAGIKNIVGESSYFGWLRVDFNKDSEIVTLIDFAYDSVSNQPIRAGGKAISD